MFRTGIALLTLTTAIQAAPAQAATSAHPCFDGSCKITVTRSVSFRVSSRYGITKISITRQSGGMVRVRGYGGGVSLEVRFDRYGSGRLNNLLVTPVSIKRRSATLRFRPL
ncbi:hypothetical protein [Nonomuraea sediminis]|uniref:hypothetical protein n=1 Tax=Nonomuraea sediminis TaxID=2835864 RepID=UPI001BDC9940|nr:hypothetical protein [Nonomuraea sediminis]